MKNTWRIFLIVLVLVAGSYAGLRTWTSADGSSSVEASFVRINGNNVELLCEDGQKISVPIDKLSEADRGYLASQGEKEGQDVGDPQPDAPELPYQFGKVSGPVEAEPESHYYYYVPKSLKPGRKASLLFYTHAGGGSPEVLQKLVQGAELCQWVLAISVESKNGQSWSANAQIAKKALKHIVPTLPVDKKRVYYAGISGGAATAFYNYNELSGYGLMPIIGYKPLRTEVPHGDCFIINGAWDFNRYAAAYARSEIGDSAAIHRFHAGGHSDAPQWLLEEGMVWLEGRYLSKNGGRHSEEREDYETAVLNWMQELRKTEPYRAYFWALFLQKQLNLSKDSAQQVEEIIKVLGADRTNRLYVEGVEDIDMFSAQELAGFGEQSLYGHTDSHITSKCESMLEEYKGVPVIEELLKSFCKPTQR